MLQKLLKLNVVFKFQAQEDLWLQAAQKLTSIITQIIEFAKMVPGFMKFPQDDQIVLLKGGKIEINKTIFLFI